MADGEDVRLGELQPVDNGSREDEPIAMTTTEEASASPGSTPSVPEGQSSSCSGRHRSSSVIVLSFDDSYLKSLPGVVRFLQIVCSIIALICVTSCGASAPGSYLLLPLSWHLRVYVFILVLGMLISFLTLILHVTSLLQILPIDWDVFDLIVYGVLAFGFLFGASLVASAIDFYQKLDGHVSHWTIEQLIISVVLGYFGLFLFAATSFMAYRRLQGSAQFGPRKFTESQASSSTGAMTL